MKKLFNATCSRCETFKPRCARVYLVNYAKPGKTYCPEPVILCEGCREVRRGSFKLAEEHR